MHDLLAVFTGKSTFFRQINVFIKEVTEELVSRTFFERDGILLYFFTLTV